MKKNTLFQHIDRPAPQAHLFGEPEGIVRDPFRVCIGFHIAGVQSGPQQLQDTMRRLEESYQTTLELLRAALDARDVETYAHSERVTHYALRLAEEMGLGRRAIDVLEQGVFLHDIGKIGIPDAILLRPGKLTQSEMEVMKTHAELGMKLISRVDFLQEAAEIVYSHQEHYDGNGYPRRLKGEAIPLNARVFSVVDALDAM